MRRLSAITAPIPPRAFPVQPFARRPLKSFAGNLTTLVLVRHQETDLSLFVSDNDDATAAVWVPKAFLQIDTADRGRFLVVTLSLPFAQQKRLSPYRIHSEKLLPEEREQLADATATAARARNALRGHRAPMSRHIGRNAFA